MGKQLIQDKSVLYRNDKAETGHRYASPILFSNYIDRPTNMTVLQAINQGHYMKMFLDTLNMIAERCNSKERVEVCWWYSSFVYVMVVDATLPYPDNTRMLVSFDTVYGTWASETSENRNQFARKGWGKFLTSLLGYKATQYK